MSYQIEHHLFPTICHVHYRRLAAIVEQTAAEFQLRYLVKPTFTQALHSHIDMLKALGHVPVGRQAA